jgi:hypothetical protein
MRDSLPHLGHLRLRIWACVDDGRASRKEHVIGLDVAVHDAPFMRIRQGFRNIAQSEREPDSR